MKTLYNNTKLSGFFIILLIFSCQGRLSDGQLNEQYLELFKNRNWNEAIHVLSELINRHPAESENYYARAIANSNLKENTILKEMINDLDKAIGIRPDDKYIFLRFQANFLAVNFDSALGDIDRLIEKKGEIPFLLSWKGNCAFASRKFEIAEKAYEKRLSLGGQYEEMRNNYYYLIFSKYFGGNKEGAVWDCAFLPDRGFKEDIALSNAIAEDKLIWKDLVNFEIPEMTISQLNEQLNVKRDTIQN